MGGSLTSHLLSLTTASVQKEQAPLVERSLEQITKDAVRAWPGVVVPVLDFVQHVAERVVPKNGVLAAIAALHTTDLYLACALAKGNARALVVFDDVFIAQVPTYVASTNADANQVEEIKQLVRTELLVARGGAQPQIAKYRGQGALGSWVRVVALRTARDLCRCSRRNVALESDEDIALQADDPEIEYLKRRYAREVKAAFRSTLAALPPKDRNLLSQYYLDELSTDTIARLYKVDGSTIRRRLARLREAILAETHRLLAGELELNRSEADSLLALVRSRIDTSLGEQLRRSAGKAG